MSNETIPASRPIAGGARRKAITVSAQSMVNEFLLDPERGLPWVIESVVPGLNLQAWAQEHREHIEQKVLAHGAVLFRNFGVASIDQFNEAINVLSPGALEYMFRASPRTRVGGNIYTSTDYPANQMIFPHNEHSYSPRFPLRLFFYCHLASETGGETPLGSTRKIKELIAPDILEKFSQKNILYVRNYGDGFGLPWQSVFQTDDKKEVEGYCASVGISVEWKENDRLRTRQVGPAFVKHPKTGEHIWFNHGTFFHVSTLPASISESLTKNFAAEDLPTNTFYGDGSPIEPEVLEQLRSAYLQSLVRFKWQQGDIIFIDNILAVHGREPFTGARKIYTGMAEACLSKDVKL